MSKSKSKPKPIFGLVIFLILIAIVIMAIAFIIVFLGDKKISLTTGNILRRGDDIDFSKLSTTTVNFRLDKVLEHPGVRADLDMMEQREFDVYVGRPDLKLKQPDNPEGDKYTSDLPPELRPVRLFISDTDDRARDSGNSCEIGGFPHRCTLNLSAKEAGKPKTVLLKVAFADKTYAEKEIVIPFGGMLKEPVVLEPKIMPKDGDVMRLKFKDIGANEYKVGAHICHPYKNNGINPCLKGTEYIITKKVNDFVWIGSQSSKDIIVKNGTIDITFPTKFHVDYKDTSVVYSVAATLDDITDAGVYTYSYYNSRLEIKR